MCFVMSLFDINRHNFGIGLCGGQMPVAEELLNIPDISTVLQHVGGTGSSDGMRRYRLFNPCCQAIFSDNGLDASGIKRMA